MCVRVQINFAPQVCACGSIIYECLFVCMRTCVHIIGMSVRACASVCIFLLKGAIDHLYMSVVVCVCV